MKNEFVFRFSFASLKTKTEKGIRYPFFVRKFENEKGKNGIYMDPVSISDDILNVTLLGCLFKLPQVGKPFKRQIGYFLMKPLCRWIHIETYLIHVITVFFSNCVCVCVCVCVCACACACACACVRPCVRVCVLVDWFGTNRLLEMLSSLN